MSEITSSYAGKKVVVTGGGGAGMGAAAVNLLVGAGAEVHVLDIKEPALPVKSHQTVDLKNPDAISAAIHSIGDGIDALFNCVGVPGNRTSDLDTFLINFAGVRHLTEEALHYFNDGGAIATIASNAGENWHAHADAYQELMEAGSFQQAVEWFESNQELLEPRRPTSAYRVSKQAVNAWNTLTAASRGERGIRQNAVMPGFTETPMGAEFRDVLGAGYFEEYPTPLGHYLRPDEPAKVLLFLNSDMASGVNGVSLMVDGGASAALKSKELAKH